eukprot:16092859-Heterocapsa_arctica.AAC.1
MVCRLRAWVPSYPCACWPAHLLACARMCLATQKLWLRRDGRKTAWQMGRDRMCEIGVLVER